MRQISIKWHVSDIFIRLLWQNVITVIFFNTKRSTPGIIDLEPCEKFWMKAFFAHPKFLEVLIIWSIWTEFINRILSGYHTKFSTSAQCAFRLSITFIYCNTHEYQQVDLLVQANLEILVNFTTKLNTLYWACG